MRIDVFDELGLPVRAYQVVKRWIGSLNKRIHKLAEATVAHPQCIRIHSTCKVTPSAEDTQVHCLQNAASLWSIGGI